MIVQFQLGDCVERMSELPDCSVGALISDPPYGIGIRGYEWDTSVSEKNQGWFQEAHRVLCPGGVFKIFGATRTFHRLCAALLDAGFVVEYVGAWFYGTGPKSLDISNFMDRSVGAVREVIGYYTIPLDSGSGRAGKPYTHKVGWAFNSKVYESTPITAPVTESAIKWYGWGTALKPAWEPILVGRKPL